MYIQWKYIYHHSSTDIDYHCTLAHECHCWYTWAIDTSTNRDLLQDTRVHLSALLELNEKWKREWELIKNDNSHQIMITIISSNFLSLACHCCRFHRDQRLAVWILIMVRPTPRILYHLKIMQSLDHPAVTGINFSLLMSCNCNTRCWFIAGDLLKAQNFWYWL